MAAGAQCSQLNRRESLLRVLRKEQVGSRRNRSSPPQPSRVAVGVLACQDLHPLVKMLLGNAQKR